MFNILCFCFLVEVILVFLFGFNDEKIDLFFNIVVWFVMWLIEILFIVLVVSDGVVWWFIVFSVGFLVFLLVVFEINEDRLL